MNEEKLVDHEVRIKLLENIVNDIHKKLDSKIDSCFIWLLWIVIILFICILINICIMM